MITGFKNNNTLIHDNHINQLELQFFGLDTECLLYFKVFLPVHTTGKVYILSDIPLALQVL